MTQEPLFETENFDRSLSFWATPPDIAARMAELADLKGKRVLEPSAGSGNLMKAALDAGAVAVTAFDIDQRNVNACRERFMPIRHCIAQMTCADFLEWPARKQYDVALMNPPWNDGVHWRHILHALKFAPRVVALAPLAMLEGADRREQFWSRVHLTALCVCSSRPAFGPEGGKMPVGCFLIERLAEPTFTTQSHETVVRFWP